MSVEIAVAHLISPGRECPCEFSAPCVAGTWARGFAAGIGNTGLFIDLDTNGFADEMQEHHHVLVIDAVRAAIRIAGGNILNAGRARGIPLAICL